MGLDPKIWCVSSIWRQMACLTEPRFEIGFAEPQRLRRHGTPPQEPRTAVPQHLYHGGAALPDWAPVRVEDLGNMVLSGEFACVSSPSCSHSRSGRDAITRQDLPRTPILSLSSTSSPPSPLLAFPTRVQLFNPAHQEEDQACRNCALARSAPGRCR